MKAYQDGIAKFQELGAKVMLISTDNLPTLRHWAGELGVSYPLLSDFADRKVAESYGVLMKDRGIANRATFVIDTDGRIQHIEEGKTALDPTGAVTACRRVKR